MSDPVLHIATLSSWQEAQRAGSYAPEGLAADGFIHCSKAGQVLRAAEAYYAGRTGLVLLVIDPGRLGSEVRWEPGTDQPGELFPHVYGPLDLEAVVAVHPFEPGPDGRFSLPASLTR